MGKGGRAFKQNGLRGLRRQALASGDVVALSRIAHEGRAASAPLHTSAHHP